MDWEQIRNSHSNSSQSVHRQSQICQYTRRTTFPTRRPTSRWWWGRHKPISNWTPCTSIHKNPVFHDIAKSVNPAQSQEHYLPTTILWTERLKPTHINLQQIHARAATSGETIAATTEATKLITNAIKIDGGLKKRVPKPFNGDRTKAEQFLVKFELFWMNNKENSHMKNPYKHSTYFLSLCSGCYARTLHILQ